MRFKAPAGMLADAVARAAKGASTVDPLPAALSGIQIIADNQLTLAATDGQRGIRLQMPPSANLSILYPGSVLLPAKRLQGLLAQIPRDAEVSVQCDDGSGTTTIHFNGARYELLGLVGEFPEFPQCGEEPQIVISTPILLQSLQSVIYAVAGAGETQEVFRGIHLVTRPDGTLEMVASDNFRAFLPTLEAAMAEIARAWPSTRDGRAARSWRSSRGFLQTVRARLPARCAWVAERGQVERDEPAPGPPWYGHQRTPRDHQRGSVAQRAWLRPP